MAGVRTSSGALAIGAGRRRADWRARDRAIGQKKRGFAPQTIPSRSALASSSLVVGVNQDLVRQALMLKTLMSHPWLIDEVAEEVAAMKLSAPALDRLRDGLLRIHAGCRPP